jgi:ABC-type dipeptide/oligopeptide/nickel transport system permease subunit
MVAGEQQVGLELSGVRLRRDTPLLSFARRFAANPAAVVGLVVLLLLAATALAAPVVAPYDPLEADRSAARAAPSLDHWFGTDEIGRDVFSRVVWGARISLPVGIIPVGFAALVGTTLGLVAGYFGRVADSLIMRLIDVMMAFPGILLAVAIVAVLGVGLQNLMFAVGVASVPLYTRLIRGSTLSVRETTYVEAATSMGAGPLRIILRHILPNVFAPLIVLITLGAAVAILAAAALSFLGLGAQPPDPEWGAMLNSSRRFLRIAWWMSVFPGLAITITVLAMNMVGDTLRDVLDPRLRE